MGGEVVILANSLISHFQWGLRHSAMMMILKRLKMTWTMILKGLKMTLMMILKGVITNRSCDAFGQPEDSASGALNVD